MSYMTQGTVQVHQKSNKEFEVAINPVPDYSVRHKDEDEEKAKDYVVLVGPRQHLRPRESLLSPQSKPYRVEDGDIRRTLTDAALREVSLELEIDQITDSIDQITDRLIIVGVKVPRHSDGARH